MKFNHSWFSYVYENKKSRFIGMAFNVFSEEKFYDILSSIEQEHKRAKHICYAYKINDNGVKVKVCSANEPKLIARNAILSVIDKTNNINIAIIVIRYFGGIKLGISKLYLAYMNASINALKQINTID